MEKTHCQAHVTVVTSNAIISILLLASFKIIDMPPLGDQYSGTNDGHRPAGLAAIRGLTIRIIYTAPDKNLINQAAQKTTLRFLGDAFLDPSLFYIAVFRWRSLFDTRRKVVQINPFRGSVDRRRMQTMPLVLSYAID